MWRHTEAVWKKAPYQNAAKQVLAYLAHRADAKTHKMRLSHSTIAKESGVSTRTVGRVIKTLIENGDIILIRKGSTDQKASEYLMAEKYQTVDTMSTVDDETTDMVSTEGNETMDTHDGSRGPNCGHGVYSQRANWWTWCPEL